MTSTVLSLIALFYVIAIVSTEARALITALDFVRKYDSNWRNRRTLFYWRFYFSSFLFHEKFAKKRNVQPAYRVRRSIELFFFTFATAALGSIDTHVLTTVGEWLGAGFVVAGGHFAFLYRNAFFSNRATIARVNALGNPKAFN